MLRKVFQYAVVGFLVLVLVYIDQVWAQEKCEAACRALGTLTPAACEYQCRWLRRR